MHFARESRGKFRDNPKTLAEINKPVPTRELLERTTLLKMDSGTLKIAAREDLLRLKEIAFRNRKSSKDAQDLEFLRMITPA